MRKPYKQRLTRPLLKLTPLPLLLQPLQQPLLLRLLRLQPLKQPLLPWPREQPLLLQLLLVLRRTLSTLMLRKS
jgi:hypothetical protein